MHGGVKIYRGSPAAARNYLEADRSRANDYYLTEGTGIAEGTSRPPQAVTRRAGSAPGGRCRGTRTSVGSLAW